MKQVPHPATSHRRLWHYVKMTSACFRYCASLTCKSATPTTKFCQKELGRYFDMHFILAKHLNGKRLPESALLTYNDLFRDFVLVANDREDIQWLSATRKCPLFYGCAKYASVLERLDVFPLRRSQC